MHIEMRKKSLNMIRVDDDDDGERKTNELRNEHMFQLPTKHIEHRVCVWVCECDFEFVCISWRWKIEYHEFCTVIHVFCPRKAVNVFLPICKQN